MIGLSNSPILTVKDLSYRFQQKNREQKIFEQLSLDIKEGEFVSLIGASGSGKSTLFKLITGLLVEQEGTITISMSNDSITTNRLGSVGYMPQKDLLLPWKTVRENILLPLEINKENTKEKQSEIKDWLQRCGLAQYEHSFPTELSGGMKQRVAFLRTLMTGKNLLLLDEPFGALDSLTKRKMHQWLLDLWGDLQKTVLFITHDLEEAILLSDRIYILPHNSKDKIKEVKVDLQRPRSSELIYEETFISLRKKLEEMIQDE